MNKMTYYLLQKNIRDALPESKRSNFDFQFAVCQKNIIMALLLSLILGTLGVDRFYVGKIGLGLLKLFTLGGFGIWTIIDWFLIMGVARSRNIEIASKLGN